MSPAMAALHGRIAGYYSARVRRYGPTPAGVDWPSERHQFTRFAQLLRICDGDGPLSLDDIGCGYGALLAALDQLWPGRPVDYLGVDLSAAMIDHARRRWAGRPCTRFALGGRSPRRADYSVASGIFNVRIDEPLRLWERFVAETLQAMAASSRMGFAVNFLRPLPASLDDGSRALYRPPPARWARFCESDLGLRVQVLDGYGLRELTLLVRSPQGGTPDRVRAAD